MEILFIRHGESEGNKHKCIQGPNTPLSQEGRKQSRELGKKLAKEHIDVVYCSTMDRAKQTAELAFGHRKIQMVELDIIQEKLDGEWEGKPLSEINWELLTGTFETKNAPGGECLLDVQKRAKAFLKILEKEKRSKIAVISHGTVIRLIIGHLLKKGIEEIIVNTVVENCSVSRVKYENGKFEVASYDFVPRLRKLG